MLTMNRSRLAMKTPTHTMRVTCHLRCMMQRTVPGELYDATRCRSQSTYEDQTCSIAGALEVVGERWTLLIVRDAMLGIRRFDEFQADLGIARNVLQTRLERLVADGRPRAAPLLRAPAALRVPPHREGPRPVARRRSSLMRWGDRHAAPRRGPPVVSPTATAAATIDDHRICVRCGERLGPQDSRPKPGPAPPSATRCAGGRRALSRPAARGRRASPRPRGAGCRARPPRRRSARP